MHHILLEWPGKSSQDDGKEHPAVYHMLDVAAVAELLIKTAPFGYQEQQAIIFLTALHDLGKISNSFRQYLRDRVPQRLGRHWEMTEVLLRHHDDGLTKFLGGKYPMRRHWLYAATAGHHGQPPTADPADSRILAAIGKQAIEDSSEVISAFAKLWPEASINALDREQILALSWWLPGFASAADWIGSNPEWFPPTRPELPLQDYLDYARKQALTAVNVSGLRYPSASDAPLFDFDLRPMQKTCTELEICDGPMLVIIEDETGSGKTEAALLLAQRMLVKGKGQGLFFALPTTATADAMFSRSRKILGRMFAEPPSLTLAHGRAGVSAEYRDLRTGTNVNEGEPICTEWLADNRRRTLLGNVGIGTIDQALLSVLPTRFSTLRHYGLSSKILIVDEVHEMGTPYMAAELSQLLKMHKQAGGSAILLTATLPIEQRQALLKSYGIADDGDRSYPKLTAVNFSAAVPARPSLRGPVTVNRLPDKDAAIDKIIKAAGQEAAVLWVRNAVDDAIKAVQMLAGRGVQADLLHARFALCDRLRHERSALQRFGKAGKDRAGKVLVATQVVESSLDLDFDVMISDLAPVAALIQRAGRLWRHMDLRPRNARPVPTPVLHVVSPDPEQVEDAHWLQKVLDSGAWVYPLDLQWRSAKVLFRQGQIDAPAGLRDLIEDGHGGGIAVPWVLAEAEIKRQGRDLSEANQAWRNLIDLSKDYRHSGAGTKDTDYPTRLGQLQQRIMLAVWREGILQPYAYRDLDGCQLSQLSIGISRLKGLTLPDQSLQKIETLKSDWPDWMRASVTVCPLGENGRICEGLSYDPEFGALLN